ncbi:DUF1232 domain-containing protein [bacterium]|nr:DUF1232 domain-containing protein [bacterium]OIO87641.1 MAG: hypothetical protein AUK02_04840 [Anaerolineae bacterium CG2_30_58_95]PIU90688.1 MAG: hypothetical protein COS63_02755 [Anaerolineae bacterium CG06_land_8_20_14_3_00_57_67]PIW21025.1 MAG: hypothetical protein COW33_00320 [Anaerolineae bacterium CG17_big_fil_post_rev_8_21_14_2_50_57_27]PIX46832.1 MAG: hypothetical protein COZ54_02855 [Anaerolineae bacterium CG_4_8_14_3_um_filter_59_70]PJH76107.1 MAG: hypothetical protein CO064_0304
MAKKTRNFLSTQNSGFFQDLVMRIKLVLRLMSDRRVNFFLKLLPIASLVYLVSPVDLAPGLALPIIGALDDAAVLWIGLSLFMSLCPDEVVQEHLNALRNVIPGAWRDTAEETDIVEVEPRDVPDEE